MLPKMYLFPAEDYRSSFILREAANTPSPFNAENNPNSCTPTMNE
jgi:hypothetical protein